MFFIIGGYLKKLGVKFGLEFGKMFGKLKEIWKESYYIVSEVDLLEKVKFFIEGWFLVICLLVIDYELILVVVYNDV